MFILSSASLQCVTFIRHIGTHNLKAHHHASLFTTQVTTLQAAVLQCFNGPSNTMTFEQLCVALAPIKEGYLKAVMRSLSMGKFQVSLQYLCGCAVIYTTSVPKFGRMGDSLIGLEVIS
jgi:hypothetical protein